MTKETRLLCDAYFTSYEALKAPARMAESGTGDRSATRAVVAIVLRLSLIHISEPTRLDVI
eukprot:8358300-Prorocentrum_lima.AAC.2